jgi:hypothetical protein
VLPESLPSSDTGIEFVAQNMTDPVQNNTSANITQLETIPSIIDQPITPTSFTPVSKEFDNSDDSGDDDSGDDDSGDDGDGGGSVAIAGDGGAFTSAG